MRAFSGSPLLVFAAMVMLAALDVLGTVFAKEWAERHNQAQQGSQWLRL
jgi:hypothetical protein